MSEERWMDGWVDGWLYGRMDNGDNGVRSDVMDVMRCDQDDWKGAGLVSCNWVGPLGAWLVDLEEPGLVCLQDLGQTAHD